MNREEARREIRERVKCTEFLTKSKSGMYNCPFCGSGEGKHGTGALKVYDTNTFTCHACNRSGDVIDLFQAFNYADYNTALSLLADRIGITIDPNARITSEGAEKPKKARKDNPEEKTKGNERSTPEDAETDRTAYFEECRKRLTDPEAAAYLKSRGININTAYWYHIGYDPQADPAGTGHPCKRIIIPSSKEHYVGRRIDGVEEFAKINVKGARPGIFNERVLLNGAKAVFVTEGAFDALSILEAGAAAVALNSKSNAKYLIERVKQCGTQATLILCLDNDKAGKEATQILRGGLQALNVPTITADICGGCKDPNEALVKDRAAFSAAIDKAIAQALTPDSTSLYIDTLMREEIARFKSDKSTGFSNLDANAGGLYSGLYCIGAISSLGKTTFALQIADQLAAAGHDVLFFSLEQSRLEMVSKSLARMQAQADPQSIITSLAIRKGYYAGEVRDLAMKYKAAIGDRMNIIEGNMKCNLSYIVEKVRNYVIRRNVRPVVFVDYLQILQAEEETRQSVREVVDTTLTELRRMARELDITVFVISSLNRSNYLAPVDFESFKESGGIEYTCDVVWGLQLACMNDEIFEKDKKIIEKREKIKTAKRETPRRIELCCLKNRYGIANYSCLFDYYPAKDLFVEIASDVPEEEPRTNYASAWDNAPTV